MKTIAVTVRNKQGVALEDPLHNHISFELSQYLDRLFQRVAVITDLETYERFLPRESVMFAVVSNKLPEQYRGKVMDVSTVEQAIESCTYCLAPFRPNLSIIYGNLFDVACTKANVVIYITVDRSPEKTGNIILESAFVGNYKLFEQFDLGDATLSIYER